MFVSKRFVLAPIGLADYALIMSLPISLSDYAAQANVQALMAELSVDNAPVLITGEAGTGKSTLVRFIRGHEAFPGTVVLAPTGIAALNVTGQTLHSFFRLPPRVITPDALTGQRGNRLWTKVNTIIIDEISMVRPDVLDGIDYILRRARKTDLPFGGVRMIFVGDFYQLPPVVRRPEAEILEHMGYATPFAYSAHVLAQAGVRTIALQEVHRQSQRAFLSVLSDLRQGREVYGALERLNDACARDHRAGVTPLILTATNATANRYNASALAQINSPAGVYSGITQGQFKLSGDNLPVPERLTLKVGARVMALKNDVNKRWVNGSLGTVTALGAAQVQVRFDGGRKSYDVAAASWETVKYVWDAGKEDVKAEVVGTYTQMPLVPAWAVTIHKSQGLTLEDVRVDLERGSFASGQAYVALSRATTLEGLSLSRPLRPSDIIVEHRHRHYLA